MQSAAASASGLPPSTLVLGVLPGVLDTEANRAAMGGPGVVTSTWTPPAYVATAVEFWCGQHADRVGGGGGGGATDDPPSGSLLRVQTARSSSLWEMS